MNVTLSARRAAAVAFSIVMMYTAATVRPETVLLETGHTRGNITTARTVSLETGRDPIRLEPDERSITLPSLRPGTHILKGTPIPQMGWRIVRVGDIGPERRGPGANSVAAGAAMMLAPAGAVGGLAVWAASVTSPWMPLPHASLLLAGGAGIVAVTALERSQPKRAVAAGVVLAGITGGGMLLLPHESEEAKPLSSCLQDDEAALARCVEEHSTLFGHQMLFREGREQLRNLPQIAAESGAPLGGNWCIIGEEALTEAYVLAGGNFEDILPEGALCDFSLEHGIGSAAGWLLADPTSVAEALCRVRDDVPRPAETQTTQCWYGIGQGASRRHGWDIREAHAVCLAGKPIGGAPNCIEGAISAALFRESAGGEPVLQLSTDLCRSLDSYYEGACVRYLAEREARSGGFRAGAAKMRRICLQEPDLQGCWSAVGTYAARGPLFLEEMGERADYCREEEGTFREDCIISLYALASFGAQGGGETVEQLLETIPPEISDESVNLILSTLTLNADKGGVDGK